MVKGECRQKQGRFELADRGTLFLDEIGDISSELQPKLLRALQEHAFERLGSTKTICVDVRLIAATHRNLQDMMRNNQ
ncbi:MAG TPA: sigma 54-interacting transcriptional regulator, partial [Candidatus Acidoferrum sp.]|nr:sigma 54-interacting transcriptional regulator [Candidatus Acidoferrum sp.]